MICYHAFLFPYLLESTMLQAIIIVLLIAIVISLATGFVFFYKDQGRSKRVMYALGVRVSLAILLMIVVFYGITTGQLTLQTPWNN
jgi:hypothetical protein